MPAAIADAAVAQVKLVGHVLAHLHPAPRRGAVELAHLQFELGLVGQHRRVQQPLFRVLADLSLIHI
mgnify:CR=1 FL=1